ncbi:hypothetical protein [Arthrobacter sp.]|uniref:hypothetical protein n=1 Tax=Arthrobacter sp. TaxID=1667 RepID=UPI00339AD040
MARRELSGAGLHTELIGDRDQDRVHGRECSGLAQLIDEDFWRPNELRAETGRDALDLTYPLAAVEAPK